MWVWVSGMGTHATEPISFFFSSIELYSYNLPYNSFKVPSIFGIVSVEEWKLFSNVIKLFCSAYGMDVSISESIFLCHNVDMNTLEQVSRILPYQMS